MHPLNRKLLRDLGHIKGQALAICLVLASGIGTFVMSLTTLQSLRGSRDTYYDRYRFAQVFANLKRAPNSLAQRIAEIPGVLQVQTRVVADVNLDVPGLEEPATGRLISIPETYRPPLNDLYLRSGRYILPRRPGEALVSESFARAHQLGAGDHVQAIINGRRQKLNLVGVALSPEYILQIRNGNDVPDDPRFGVFWMAYEELASAFDMDGAFNDVSLTLMHGASEQEAIERLDDLIEPYGGTGAYARRDQASHFFLDSEISALRGMGLIVPSVFLAVAAFLLNVVMTRVISTQREQIAALKAFGYTNLEVGWHYLKLVLLISAVGAAIGIVSGTWLGRGLTGMYAQFYRFPQFYYSLDPSIAALAVLISAAAATLGTLAAVRSAVRLPAAEAMRPEPPAVYRPTVVERLGLQRLLPQAARMILRHLERKPFKAALSILGISVAVSVLILGSFITDSLDYLLDFQFNVARPGDMAIIFNEPASAEAIHDVRRLPGVLYAEPIYAVSMRIRHGHIHRRGAITGLPADSRLFRLIDPDEATYALPPEGLMLSSKLAGILQARIGDTVTVEVMEGHRPVRDIRVVGILDEFSGTAAYMRLDAVHRLMREGDTVNGARMITDPRYHAELYRELKHTPRVASVRIKAMEIQSFEDTQAENQRRIQFFNVIFAMIIAAGVVYNTARISLAEHSRELATLRVIGFTRGEISWILLGELALLALLALPVGMVMGYWLAHLAARAIESEMWRIPVVITRWTYGFAAAITLAAAVLSGLVVRRKLDHLDLIAVLKSKE